VDIYDFAMQMEQDGERFYRTLADSVPDKGLKSIFTTLAEEELKHFRTIQRMKANTFSMEDSSLLEGIKSIFKVMQANPPKEFLKEEAQEKPTKKPESLRRRAGSSTRIAPRRHPQNKKRPSSRGSRPKNKGTTKS